MNTESFSFEKYDNVSTQTEKFDLISKLEDFNNSFKTNVESVKENFGQIEQHMEDSSIVKKIGTNDVGNASKQYYDECNGKILKSVESIGEGTTRTTYYDGKQTAYLEEISNTLKNTSELKVKPNIEIIKENYSAHTDEFGRTVKSKMDDVHIKDAPRNQMDKSIKDSSYKIGDDRGHIIADNLGGPATKENIIPQQYNVNRSQMKAVENRVKKLVEEGHKVDYEVKVNYVADDPRPSSFEPKIYVDGVEYTDLPEELKKIYNEPGKNAVQKVATDVGERFGLSNKAGLEQGAIAATVTCTMSTVDNVTACINGEITADQAAINIAKDTAASGVLGYGAGFITHEVSSALATSSNTLISSLGNSCLPAAAVSLGISSYDSVMDFAKGEIGADELAYDLGENAVGIAGSIGGSAMAGAAFGSIVPGAGTIVGAGVGLGVGLIGGMIGYAVTTGAYETVIQKAGDALDAHSEELESLQEKAETIAHDSINLAAEIGTDAATDVRNALNDFNIKNSLPFKI